MVELGDLYSQEVRKVLMKFKIPALAHSASPGSPRRARLRRAAWAGRTGRVLADQRQRRPWRRGRRTRPAPHRPPPRCSPGGADVKRRASEVFEHGQFDEGQRLIGETKSRLSASLQAAPEALKPEIRAEIDEVEQMDQISFEMGVGSAR